MSQNKNKDPRIIYQKKQGIREKKGVKNTEMKDPYHILTYPYSVPAFSLRQASTVTFYMKLLKLYQVRQHMQQKLSKNKF